MRRDYSDGLATGAQAWPWCSAHARLVGGETPVPLAPPGGLPQDWLDWVNRPHTDKELAALQRCIDRGVPFSREPRVKQTAADLGLQSTLRPRGRPRIAEKGS